MTKEELESKFEDCFDANTKSSEGGYGPDVTDRLGTWRHFDPIVSEYAKQQSIAFGEFLSLNGWTVYGIANQWINGKEEIIKSNELYLQFIEQQIKEIKHGK